MIFAEEVERAKALMALLDELAPSPETVPAPETEESELEMARRPWRGLRAR